jgi:arabinose-5-phosphate isomerase
MGKNPSCISPDALVQEAAAALREARVDQLPVADAQGRCVGLLDVQDLLSARVL